MIVTVSVTAAVTLTKPKIYEATADVAIYPQSSTDPNLGPTQVFKLPGDGSSPIVAAAFGMDNPEVRDRTFARLKRPPHVSLTVTPLSQANFLAATASARSPHLAARAANTFARVFIRRRAELFHEDIQKVLKDVQAQMRAIPADQR